MKKQLISLAFLSILFASVEAQEKNPWIENELLVQLEKQTWPNELILKCSDIELSSPKLISKHMNIWQFTFNTHLANTNTALQSVNRQGGVIVAQKNHIIKKRNTPNDPSYNLQWQYEQANDKDIDAPEAWDITTGGVTPNGDTIVVCVIDDGIFLDHEDLEDNLWINRNEIANNGMDDDGNGYIDDMFGWNAENNNNDVDGNSVFGYCHGMPVAAIIGAKGNNAKGVVGVNWNVKLMIVKGGGNEAEALAAYDYALSNRKLYNSTNGEKGAFVVATNASWGIDGGQANQAPLWCAMYDTLGNYGVLNAGATANNDINVDEFGDLPTSCPSDFLISVTNTNNNDTKVQQAGYGATTIDLGAPGEGTHTISGNQNNTYDAFGGTSGATPHVAGAIALLYAVPCQNFADLSKSNPKSAAALARDFIFNGADSISSLEGITVTGGRLNLKNTLQALVDECNSLLSTDVLTFAGKITIYPNPIRSHNTLNVSVENLRYWDNSNIILEVIDLRGKTVVKQEFNNKSNLKIQLPNNLQKGLYFIKLVNDSQSIAEKFVVE